MKTFSSFPFLWKNKRFFFLWILLLFSTYAEAIPGIINISWPINRSVIQRNSSNQANVYFAGQFQPLDGGPDCPSYDYYYQVERLSLDNGTYTSTEVSWTQFFLQSDPSGLFYVYHPLPVGWYDLKVKATSGGINGSQKAYATVRFGVGDVYVIAGQSNAQGVGTSYGFSNSSFPVITSYDCVSVHNYDGNCQSETDLFPTMQKLIQDLNFRVGPNGHNAWNWAALGRLIALEDHVPTAFFNAAAGGSSVQNWREGSNGDPTNHYLTTAQYCAGYVPGEPNSYYYGQPYSTFKNILKYYAKVFGIKAVLWHQGETDNYLNTSTASYQSHLIQVINKTRTDFGNTNLTWFVSRASYNSGTVDGNIITAQNNVINLGYAKAGPETDNITTRIPADNTHFWKTGLDELANRWRIAINATSSNMFSPAGPPAAIIVGPSPYYAQAPSGYAEYRWANTNRSSPISTSQLADVNARCFVKTYGGDWFITPYYISEFFCTGGFRIGVEELTVEEPGYNLMISSNPVVDQSSNITFNLAKGQNVRLEIMDEKGITVKKIADGPHAAGKYTYPIWMQNRTAGTYICVLQADGLGMTKRFVLVR